MTKQQIDELVIKYPLIPNITPDTEPWSSQYDRRSASINYALVRHFQPTVIVEFGTRGGRCTHDILKGLLDNGKEFIYKPYELENGLRRVAQENLKRAFGDKAPTVGGDILKATDIPDNIDYLFIDNYHDELTTDWVFNTLFKKCIDNCLVHFHDIQLSDDTQFVANAFEGEIGVFKKYINSGNFPLTREYFTYPEGNNGSSTWWRLKK